MERKKRRQRIIANVVMIIVVIVHIVPLLIVALNSLRSKGEITSSLIGIAQTPVFENFSSAWVRGNYASAYVSTFVIGFTTALLVMVFTGLAAYGVLKTNSYGKTFFNHYFVVGLSIPYFAMMVPVFFLFHKLQLVDTQLGMILLYTAINIPFCYMFVHAYLKELPKELDEAARIDGCTELQNFFHIILPISKPIMSSVILITFVNCWNEFMFSNLFLQNVQLRTVSLQFYNFVGQYASEYGMMYAAAIITIVPIIVIYLFTQNSFIDGMTAGSVKG